MGKKIDFTEFSRKGGNATKERHGSEFYSKIASLGAQKRIKKEGNAHFKEMARKSVEARKKRKEEKEKSGVDKLAKMITG